MMVSSTSAARSLSPQTDDSLAFSAHHEAMPLVATQHPPKKMKPFVSHPMSTAHTHGIRQAPSEWTFTADCKINNLLSPVQWLLAVAPINLWCQSFATKATKPQSRLVTFTRQATMVDRPMGAGIVSCVMFVDKDSANLDELIFLLHFLDVVGVFHHVRP